MRLLLRILLSTLFLFAGTIHLIDPGVFLPFMPPFIPFPTTAIFISGLCELLGGIGLWVSDRRIQVLTGWGLALLLVAVFPVNLYMATIPVKIHDLTVAPWMTWARLPVQPLLILAVVWVTRLLPAKHT